MTKLYDDFIMDYIRNARNFRVIQDASRTVHGANTFCGDEMTLYLRLEDERIEDIAFQCMSCGISMASASIMTEHVKGRPVSSTLNSIRAFIDLLHGNRISPAVAAETWIQAMLESLGDSRSRVGCATLAWTTLESALQSQQPHSA